jgi:hypothetical protein
LRPEHHHGHQDESEHDHIEVPERLSVSTTNQNDGHPSITPDGTTLRYDLQLDAQSTSRLRGAARARAR